MRTSKGRWTSFRRACAMRAALLVVLSVMLLAAACGGTGTSDGAGSVSSPPIQWVRGHAGRLRVFQAGKGGLPVVFVHGLGGTHAVWNEQVAHLSPHRLVVTLDLRGHGESSPPPDGDYTVGSVAQDIGAVADGLGLQRFVLVGHSWGGALVAEYGSRHPERVAGILFADPVGDLSMIPQKDRDDFLKKLQEGDLRQNVDGFFSGMFKKAAPGVQDQVMATVRRTPPTLFLAVWKDVFAYSPTAGLKAFPNPMLTVVTPENNEPFSLQNLVPGLPSKRMEGVSHWIMMDRPAEFDAIMDGFLRDLR